MNKSLDSMNVILLTQGSAIDSFGCCEQSAES